MHFPPRGMVCVSLRPAPRREDESSGPLLLFQLLRNCVV